MHLSIRTKLTTIFILLVAFMAVSMTVALVGLSRLDQRINHLVDQSAAQIRATLLATASLNDGMRELKNVLLAWISPKSSSSPRARPSREASTICAKSPMNRCARSWRRWSLSTRQ
jgi:phosphoglycerate-specific signal transduction histidine kinase